MFYVSLRGKEKAPETLLRTLEQKSFISGSRSAYAHPRSSVVVSRRSASSAKGFRPVTYSVSLSVLSCLRINSRSGIIVLVRDPIETRGRQSPLVCVVTSFGVLGCYEALLT